MIIIISFFSYQTCFCVRIETSQEDASFTRDVSTTHTKHDVYTVIEMDHEHVLFSENSVSQSYFELASISKKRRLIFRDLTV